jgi:hypothetical protein
VILELVQQFRNFGSYGLELHMTSFVVADRSAACGVEVQCNTGPEMAFDPLWMNGDQRILAPELSGRVAYGLHLCKPLLLVFG